MGRDHTPRDVVIVDAVRSPIGKRNGGLSRMHSVELLGDVLAALVRRVDIDPLDVDRMIGGCVNQIGMQAANVARNAWLGAGLPQTVPGTTVNVQCGSSQEAVAMAHGLLAGGQSAVVVACGVESLSQLPLGSNIPVTPDYGHPRGGRYATYYEPTTQHEAADRLAEQWSLTRDELDSYGLRSQQLASRAWDRCRFDGQVVQINAPSPTAGDGATMLVDRDEGLRTTSLDALATLRPNLPDRRPAFHTAGTSSQISDGAAAMLLMTATRADELGLRPRARLVASVLAGSNPELMLLGPTPATSMLLRRSGLSLDDIDLFEINEAFASVVLVWQREVGADPTRVNVNGGAIALGHPLGASGVILLTKALYELERRDGRYALVSMCCGGGLGTGSLIELA